MIIKLSAPDTLELATSSKAKLVPRLSRYFQRPDLVNISLMTWFGFQKCLTKLSQVAVGANVCGENCLVKAVWYILQGFSALNLNFLEHAVKV